MTLKERYFKITLTMLMTEYYISNDYIEINYCKFYFRDYHYIEDILEDIQKEL